MDAPSTVPATDRFAHLERELYELSEIAFMLNMKVRTVRTYLNKDSNRYPDRKLLVAAKNRGVYRVTREDLKMFLQEIYGG